MAIELSVEGILSAPRQVSLDCPSAGSPRLGQIEQHRIDAMNNENFMRRAIALSREMMEQGQGGPFGAVIVRDGKIIAEGSNQVTSTHDPTAHAEIVAIRSACSALRDFSLKGCEIYTSCEPCPMCLAAIYWARLDRIYYANSRVDAARIGFDDEFLYQEIPRPIEQRSLVTTRMLPDEAIAAFEAWEKKVDKVKY
jgi:tRNA(Arg) A34 adenosine deaminase TadA